MNDKNDNLGAIIWTIIVCLLVVWFIYPRKDDNNSESASNSKQHIYSELEMINEELTSDIENANSKIDDLEYCNNEMSNALNEIKRIAEEYYDDDYYDMSYALEEIFDISESNNCGY